MPAGAEITDAGDDGTYRGTFSVRLAHDVAYRGELNMEELDEAARRVVMRASGQDKRGQGSAKASIVSTMHEEGDVTRVDVETDFTITGRPRASARRDDPGHLEPAAEGLRRVPPAEDRGTAGRATPERRLTRRPRPPSRSAASSSSARYSTDCAGCSAAADAIASPSQAGSSRRNAGSIVCGIGDSR